MATPANLSVEKSFALMSVLAAMAGRNGGPRATVAHLARESGLSPAAAHRLLRTLEALGAVARDDRGGYRLGAKLAQLGAAVDLNALLAAAARPHLKALAIRFGRIAHLGALDDEAMVMYLAKETPGAGFQVHTVVGARLEAYCSGLGKALLAWLPPGALDAYLADGPFIPLTGRTITEPAAVRAHLRGVRAQGYALDDGEIREDLLCVAAPIVDGSGAAAGAVSVSGARDNAPAAEMIAAVRAAAAAISQSVFKDKQAQSQPMREEAA